MPLPLPLPLDIKWKTKVAINCSLYQMEWRGVEARPTLDHADPQRVQPFGVLWKGGRLMDKCAEKLKMRCFWWEM